jgi:hypothetical protein
VINETKQVFFAAQPLRKAKVRQTCFVFDVVPFAKSKVNIWLDDQNAPFVKWVTIILTLWVCRYGECRL